MESIEMLEQDQKTDNKNINDKCQSVLSIGDDYGNNSCTMRCQLKSNHPKTVLHREEYQSFGNGKVIVQWEKFGEEEEDEDEP